ncbi:DUF917 domain-containing protein [Phytoactinopolyspora limicola]|uniref:DUF917 domain-containing protein n=1 Tax=Phytoactinopolyspora limicola TaxID=2715536 RepID=UPI00140A7564|nr:DUF917 domain-containing protein [Phytoactinopolyspora limicola]
MWELQADDVGALARGAALVGGGGGGSTRAAALVAERALQRSGPLHVVEAGELAPDAHGAALGLVGSVTVFEEKPLSGAEFTTAVRALERYTGIRLDAVLGFEAAGVNALLAVAAAAALELPLVDADGMGRAFPQLDQTVFTLHGLAVSPMVLSGGSGALAVLDGVDGLLGEQLARSAVVTMGGWAMVVFAPQSGADLARYAITGTIRRAIELGRLLGSGTIDAILTRHGGRALFRGRVVDVIRDSHGRFGGGSAVLEHLDGGRYLRVEFQNENLLVLENGEVRACVPDIICLLEADRCVPVTSERLRYGLELDVITLPCAPAWRTPAGLGLVGPRAFGYDVPYAIPRGER